MTAPGNYDHLADVFAKAYGDVGTIPDALRLVDVYRLHVLADETRVESFRLITVAARHFGVTVRRVLDGDRHRACCAVRWVVARILREQGWSTVQIAPVVGLRNHTTILHALEHMDDRPDLLAAARDVLDIVRTGRDATRAEGEGAKAGAQ